MERRSENVIFSQILEIAANDPRIRVVILNGSRTSPNAIKDIFQDFDIVYFINSSIEAFVNDAGWIKQFGDILICKRQTQ
jgi:aminoglycoside 6-adenylyltransferase